MFQSVPYVDAMEVLKSRFNLEETDLVSSYGELIGDGLNTLDPFNDSAQAVDAWESGDFEPLVLHNIVDVRRTAKLTRLTERYCSKSDFSMKNLESVAKSK